jgi:hypothetical protein
MITVMNPEYNSLYSMYHPEAADVDASMQFAPFYQPIDEIRDYFGDHVAIYFAFEELYTRALVWPAVWGCFGMLTQWHLLRTALDLSFEMLNLPLVLGQHICHWKCSICPWFWVAL